HEPATAAAGAVDDALVGAPYRFRVGGDPPTGQVLAVEETLEARGRIAGEERSRAEEDRDDRCEDALHDVPFPTRWMVWASAIRPAGVLRCQKNFAARHKTTPQL